MERWLTYSFAGGIRKTKGSRLRLSQRPAQGSYLEYVELTIGVEILKTTQCIPLLLPHSFPIQPLTQCFHATRMH